MSTEEQNNKEEKSFNDEIKGNIAYIYSMIEDWMRPNKSHPIILQVLLFILKLPVLLVILLLSPILLVVLLLVFLIAL